MSKKTRAHVSASVHVTIPAKRVKPGDRISGLNGTVSRNKKNSFKERVITVESFQMRPRRKALLTVIVPADHGVRISRSKHKTMKLTEKELKEL